MGLILLIFVALLIVGGLPVWSYSKTWGYRPVGGLSVILTILLILVLIDYLPRSR